MSRTTDHPREFQINTFQDYQRFWDYYERSAFAKEAARQLRNGVAIKVCLEPGDMTAYKLRLIPVRERSSGVASQCRESFLDEETETHSRVIVRLDNCGEGWATIYLIGNPDPITISDLMSFATDRCADVNLSTRYAIAGLLEAIRLADHACKTGPDR